MTSREQRTLARRVPTVVAMKHRRPPRLKGFDYLGCHRYFVTCCTLDRHEAFTRDETALPVHAEIVRTCAEFGFEEIASVQMPDHLHGLFTGHTDNAEFVPFMTRLLGRTGTVYRRLRHRKLWQKGYYERVLRSDEDTPDVAKYILENPIRRRLVASVKEYPYVWCKYGLDIEYW